MLPESPVIPGTQPEKEIVWAKDQPQYIPLPSLRRGDGIILTRWVPEDDDLAGLSAGADLIVWQWVGNNPQFTRVDILSADAASELLACEYIAPADVEFIRVSKGVGYFRFSFTEEQIDHLSKGGHLFVWVWAATHLHPLRPQVVQQQPTSPMGEGEEGVALATEVPQ